MNLMRKIATPVLVSAIMFGGSVSMALAKSAYLEITLHVIEANRAKAAGIYAKYKQPFLTKIAGAKSKELLVRGDDVQVLHGFATVEDAENYLKTDLFTHDIVGELAPLLANPPEVRIYEAQ